MKDLISQMGKEIVDLLKENAKAGSFVIKTTPGGGIWISIVDGTWGSWKGQVVSLYYHPTYPHTATTEGKLGMHRSHAAPGKWAISIQTKAMWGNKSFYNTLQPLTTTITPIKSTLQQSPTAERTTINHPITTAPVTTGTVNNLGRLMSKRTGKSFLMENSVSLFLDILNPD